MEYYTYPVAVADWEHQPLPFTLEEALADKIVCQKRTSKAKQFVIMDGEYVYKGPYTDYKLSYISWRSHYFSQWHTPHVVLPAPYIFDSDSGPFLQFPNIAAGYEPQCQRHTEGFTGLTYWVMERRGVVKLLELLRGITPDWVWDQQPSLLLAYIHCYILRTGDVGLHNTLVDVDQQMIYIVDYDETRGNQRDDEVFYFNKRPALFQMWVEHARPAYPEIIEYLRVLSASMNEADISEFGEYISGAIGLLQDYAGTAPQSTPARQKRAASEGTGGTLGPVGGMVYKGPFGGSTTYSGYSVQAVKSALQKYVRRGILDKALMAAFELYRMAELPNGQSIQTNMYNRLAIIAAEDIGPAQFSVCISVTNTVLEGNRNTTVLAALVQLMCESAKTRIMSHAYRALATTEGQVIAQSMGILIETSATSEEEMAASEMGKKLWVPGDPQDIQLYANMFYLRVSQHRISAWTWLGYYMEVTTDVTIRPRKQRKARTDPMLVIWQILSDFLPQGAYLILRDAYLHIKEKRPFLFTAVIAALYRTPWVPLNLTAYIHAWEDSPTITQLLTGDYTFELDPYVLDIHTPEGRARGATRVEFRHEGALITNPSPTYTNEKLEQVYLALS